MQGVHLEDVRRALDARDPMLPLLIVSLASGPDHVPSAQGAPPPASGELDWSGFLREIGSWRFGQKSDEERRRYRTESLAALRAQERLPERLWLDAIVLELWEEQGAYARSVLLQIVRDVPIKWGPWRALKLIFKQAEERHDTEMLGAVAARLDAARSSRHHSTGEVSPGTMIYMVRRAWRYLRRVGESFPSRYADAAVDFLRAYPADTVWERTWVANHVFFHQQRRYNQSNFRYWRLPSDLLEHRAFGAAWVRSPRPLFTLLEQASAEVPRRFAIEALKRDFRTVLREVDASWVARLSLVEQSAEAHDFMIWLLQNVPKFEAASFRQMGLHDPALRLLESPSDKARTWAAEYARTHARDLEIERLVALVDNSNKSVRTFALSIIGQRDARSEVGLAVWGQLLETSHGRAAAVKALSANFGASDLTPEWFRERLQSTQRPVVAFAMEHLPKVHPPKKLGADFYTSLLESDELGSEATTFALDQLAEHFDLSAVDQDVWRRALLRPSTSRIISRWIESERLPAKAFGVDFWRALAYHESWKNSSFAASLREDDQPKWAKEISFSESLAQFSRGLLGDVRQFAPKDVGFDWLMELVERMERGYHDFAEGYMLKAFAPADFAPADDTVSAAPASSASASADLGERTFLFTGKLSTMTRSQAEKKVTDAHGKNAKSVVAALDYLVVGDEGSPLFGQGKKGSKMVKAEALQEKGSEVKIISETAFLQMLAGQLVQADESQVEAGSEALWEMATEGAEGAPRARFARAYILQHHTEIAPQITDRQVDPGAEIPREFFSWDRVRPLLTDERRAMRTFGLRIARAEFARWAPPLSELVALCEASYKDVTAFISEALLAPETKENASYHLGREALDVAGVYRFCESLDRTTRRIGMGLIERYEDLAQPEALFRLTQSPDRALRAFVVRTIWSLYRDRAITDDWQPTEIAHRYMESKAKRTGSLRQYETGPGPRPRPETMPADQQTLASFLRRILYGLPPTKPAPEKESSVQALTGEARARTARHVPARRAKRATIEVMRDLAIEQEAFAEHVAPLFAEFVESTGRAEREACLVALAQLDEAHPGHNFLSDALRREGLPLAG